jgi:hypothetical protein
MKRLKALANPPEDEEAPPALRSADLARRRRG